MFAFSLVLDLLDTFRQAISLHAWNDNKWNSEYLPGPKTYSVLLRAQPKYRVYVLAYSHLIINYVRLSQYKIFLYVTSDLYVALHTDNV